MIAGKHSLPAGGSKNRTLQKLSKLADSGGGIAYASTNENCGGAAPGDLFTSGFYLLRRRSRMRTGIPRRHRGYVRAYGRKKEIVRNFNESRSRQRSVKNRHSLSDRLNQ